MGGGALGAGPMKMQMSGMGYQEATDGSGTHPDEQLLFLSLLLVSSLQSPSSLSLPSPPLSSTAPSSTQLLLFPVRPSLLSQEALSTEALSAGGGESCHYQTCHTASSSF